MSYATADERYFVELINQARAGKNLSPLKIERHLNDSAEDHSTWMLDRDIFSHTGINGSRSNDRIKDAGFDLSGSWRTAENIAYVSIQGVGDLRDEIRQLHSNLMNSPSHYANITGDFGFVGIGLEVGTFTTGGRSYKVLMATQNFGKTQGATDVDTGNFDSVKAPGFGYSLQNRAEWQRDFNGRVFLDAQPGSNTHLNDDFRLTGKNDNANGGNGNDWMAGNGGADRLHGGAGHDNILGGFGNDTLFGGNGNDTLRGEMGNDRLDGGNGADLILGGKGYDIIFGRQGADKLLGGAGHDRIDGGAGNDWLRGEFGNDTLIGGAGNDTLHGGFGDDVLNGNGGYDVFVFQKGFGRDVINQYEEGHDRILIARELLGHDAGRFLREHIRETADGVVIDLGKEGRITLHGNGLTADGVGDDIFAI